VVMLNDILKIDQAIPAFFIDARTPALDAYPPESGVRTSPPTFVDVDEGRSPPGWALTGRQRRCSSAIFASAASSR